MDTAFYVPEGDGFVSTELTRGPWDRDSQHAGPPAALLGRELERLAPASGDGEWQLGRITFELLRAVPIAPLAMRARVLRPGRSVELVEARLEANGNEVMRATGWRLRTTAVDVSGHATPESPAPPSPERGEPKSFFPTGEEVGYHTAMDYRFVAGEFLEPGPATTWMRMRHPLVADETPSPLARVLIAADTGNGISATLDFERYLFINVDLTVHLHRLPAGEWVCLEARTTPEPSGIGLCESALYDERGPIGRALQTLLVRER
jgi:Thioesterase-like superfamily